MITARNPAQFQSIRLMWRPLPHTERLFVGTLRRTGEAYTFSYDGADVDRAEMEGFDGYPGLPLDSGPFNGQAMAAFAARNPSPARADYARLLQLWAIPADSDPFTVLGLTGGRLPTDLFEFVPEIEAIPGTEFVSNLAGIQLFAEADDFRRMQPGEGLSLELDPTNAFDGDAVRVMSDGHLVAYVKKGHSSAVATALRAGLQVSCTLERALVNGVVREVLVRLQFQ